MLSMETTSNYAGVTLYGDYFDLKNLYETISYLADSDFINIPKLSDYLLGLCYDIRHAYQGQRESIQTGYDKESKYYGVKILYPILFFQFKALRWLAGYKPTSSNHQANLYSLQACLEGALKEIDAELADNCMYELTTNFGLPSDYLIIFWDKLNERYIKMTKKGRKDNLLNILRSANPICDAYNEFKNAITAEAKRLGVSPQTLELKDEDIDFKW